MNPFKFALNAYLLKREPISIIHFITNKCNARCAHCFLDFNNPELFRNELTLSEVEDLTRKLGRNLFNVNITGGEPFLREDIFDIISLYFQNTPIESIVITTNGMFTDSVKRFVEKVVASHINGRIKISISIDNFGDKHDENRNVPGLFQNAIKTYTTIDSFGDKRLLASVNITVTPYNYKDVVPLFHRLKDMGVQSFNAVLMREEGVVTAIDQKAEVAHAYRELCALIQSDRHSERPVGFAFMLQEAVVKAKNVIVNKILYETSTSPKFILNCSAGSLLGVIHPNGDVYPCEVLCEHKLGNLRDYGMDFLFLWKSARVEKSRKFIKKSQCVCTYECAWSINIISNLRFIPKLIVYSIRNLKWRRKK
jgi:radical SAM protein with 4Fe4S-binding SPASM domain